MALEEEHGSVEGVRSQRARWEQVVRQCVLCHQIKIGGKRERVRGKKGGEGGDTDWETCMFHDRRVDGSHMTEEVEEALCFAIFVASAVAVIIVHFKIDSHGHVIDEVAKDVSPLRCVVASADGGADGNVFHYQKEKQNKTKKKNEQEDKPKKEKKKFIKIPD